MSPNEQEIERLLENGSWVRRLARRLLYDESLVDDVVQEAWIAAIQKPPSKPQALGAWLKAVVRSLALRANRSRTRRAHHEGQIDDPPPVSAPDQIVEQLETQQRIASAVAELREPYRSVVYLHFFEDLKLVEIAERVGASDSTVRTRLQRGIEKLRDSLSRRMGGRELLSAALLPLVLPRSMWASPELSIFEDGSFEEDDGPGAERPGSPRQPFTSRIPGALQASALIGLALMVVIGVVSWKRAGDAPDSTLARASSPPFAQPDLVPRDQPVVSVSDTRSADRDVTSDRVAAEVVVVRGAALRVVDRASGKPLAAARVFRAPFDRPDAIELGVTDAEGRLELDEAPREALIVLAAGYVEFREPELLRPSTEHVVELEPEYESRVRVLNDGGDPLPGARVRVRGQRRGMPSPDAEEFQTDARGEVVYRTRHYDTRILVEADGHATALIPASPPLTELRLRHGRPLRLRVLDRESVPVVDCRVRFEGESRPVASTVFSGDDGGVDLGQVRPGSLLTIELHHPEYASVRREVKVPETGDIELVLEPGFRLRGDVQADDGQPIDGGFAFLFVRRDAGSTEAISKLNIRRETEASGRLVPIDRARIEAGRFVLGPVAAVGSGQLYFGVIHPDFVNHLEIFDGESDRPTSIRLDRGRTLEGRVRSPSGLPLGGVQLHFGDRWTDGTAGILGRVKTRDDGSFRIDGMPGMDFGDGFARVAMSVEAFAPDELIELNGRSILDSRETGRFRLDGREGTLELVAASSARSSLVDLDWRDTRGRLVRERTPVLVIDGAGSVTRSVLFRNQSGARLYSDHTLTLPNDGAPTRILLLPESGRWLDLEVNASEGREILEVTYEPRLSRPKLDLHDLRVRDEELTLAVGYPFGSETPELLLGLGSSSAAEMDVSQLPVGTHRVFVLRDHPLDRGDFERWSEELASPRDRLWLHVDETSARF